PTIHPTPIIINHPYQSNSALCLVSPAYLLTISPSFFFNDTATTEIYTLSLHTLFRSSRGSSWFGIEDEKIRPSTPENIAMSRSLDRKSTRLNSSHVEISYAVFCLKKKMWSTYLPLCSAIL